MFTDLTNLEETFGSAVVRERTESLKTLQVCHHVFNFSAAKSQNVVSCSGVLGSIHHVGLLFSMNICIINFHTALLLTSAFLTTLRSQKEKIENVKQSEDPHLGGRWKLERVIHDTKWKCLP